MKNIIKFLSIVSLFAATPAIALNIEDSITEDALIFTKSQKEGNTITGRGCVNMIEGLTPNACSQAIITGLEIEAGSLNFHFLNKQGNGFMFIAEREPTNGAYKVLGWTFELSNNFSEVRSVVDGKSGCTINVEKFKVFCTALDKKTNENISSGVLK